METWLNKIEEEEFSNLFLDDFVCFPNERSTAMSDNKKRGGGGDKALVAKDLLSKVSFD